MKVFICLFALLAAVSASVLHHAPAVLSTGSSSSSRTQDAAGNYAFAYNEQHATGGSSRSEQGSPGVATGSYTLNVADGRSRIVNYVADAHGFRAAIATNEPGTAALPAANTAIASPFAAPQPVAPLVHAPVAVAHAEPVAVAHAAPLLHAPVAIAHAAPVLHAAVVPAVSSYSSVINHAAPALVHSAPAFVHAAPVAVAAPLHAGHYGAPLLHHY